jgi:hypothetical protein
MVEMGNIIPTAGNVDFFVKSDGQQYHFRVPVEVIEDYLGENDERIAPQQFVLVNTELFEEIAEDRIDNGIREQPVIITLETINEYFQ